MASSRNSPHADPAAVLAAFLPRHLNAGGRLAVGLSGGLDSVLLLHLTAELLPRLPPGCLLTALHVHHGISPNADAWAAFCAELCGELGVPLAVARVAVPAGPDLEERARAARYAAFRRVDADWLLLAHHRDDQAETLLLNLLRGAGVRGAAAMPAWRPLGGDKPSAGLLRPLLALPRSALLECARARGLRWIEDESNADTAIKRNFLRRELLPRLAPLFPGAAANLASAAARFGEAARLLDALAELDLAGCTDEQGRLLAARLARLDAARARNALRAALRRAGLRAVASGRLAEALRQLLGARADSAPCVRLEGAVLRRYRGVIHVLPGARGESVAPVAWRGEAQLPWGAGRVRFERAPGGIAAAALARGPWVLRTRRGGERLRLAAGRPPRSLKNLFQEAGVPPWEREQLPLLWCGDDLVWVARLGIALEYRAKNAGADILPSWEAAAEQQEQ